MIRKEITLRSVTRITPNVIQAAAATDYDPKSENVISWTHELLFDEKDWNVGLIVGQSGSGKTTLAKTLFEEQLESFEWDDETAIIDSFGDLPVSEITSVLTSVGLGDIPAWIRPYRTLSTGEQFRADMARAILSGCDPVVVDEFTSVVDRQVAKVVSHTVQKTIRRREGRFVAVSCHFDIIDWLQPDWVYNVDERSFVWRSVQPHPRLSFEVRRCGWDLWRMFSRYHYMSAQIPKNGEIFALYHEGRPIAVTSYRYFPHPKVTDIRMGARLVVLPDWQGLGIATILETWLGEYLHERGLRYRNAVAHPTMVRIYSGSPRWKQASDNRVFLKSGKRARKSLSLSQAKSRRLSVKSFEYVPVKDRSTLENIRFCEVA